MWEEAKDTFEHYTVLSRSTLMLWNKLGQLEHLTTPPPSISRETKALRLRKPCLEFQQLLTWRPLCPSLRSAWRGAVQGHEPDLLLRRSSQTLTWRCPGRSQPPQQGWALPGPECSSARPNQGCTTSACQCPPPNGHTNGEMERLIDEKLFKRKEVVSKADLVEETSAQRHVLCRKRGKYWRCFIWTIHSQHSFTEVHDGILDTIREKKKTVNGLLVLTQSKNFELLILSLYLNLCRPNFKKY